MLDQRRAAGERPEPAPRRQDVAESRLPLRAWETSGRDSGCRPQAPLAVVVKQARRFAMLRPVQSERAAADRMSQRLEMLGIVADRILRLPSDRTARVGIDGVDGAGKTMFADELAQVLRAADRPVIRASVDGFHRPKSERYRRGRGSPEGYFEDSYNYTALKTALLDPLGPGGTGRYRTAVFDHVKDMPVAAPECAVAPASILVLDGIFLHRPELRDTGMYRSFSMSPSRCRSRAVPTRRHVARSRSGCKPQVCRGTDALSADMRPARAGYPGDRQQRFVVALYSSHSRTESPCHAVHGHRAFKDVAAIAERFKRLGRMLPEGVACLRAGWSPTARAASR